MAKQIQVPLPSGSAAPSGQATDVRSFERFTVYAANGSVVSLSPDNGATFIPGPAVGASGILTVTDLATQIKVNASYRLIGLYAHEGD